MFPNPIFLGYTPAERRQNLGAFLPVVLVLLGEVAALALAARRAAMTVTPFSLAVAGSIAAIGIITVAVRPSRETRLAGILAVLLAGLIVVPLDLTTLHLTPEASLAAQTSPAVMLRYYMGVLVITVGLHLVSRFPPRSASVARFAPSDRALFVVYIVTTVLSSLVLFTPGGWWRLVLWSVTIAWLVGVLAFAHFQLILVSRDPDPAYARAAKQARLLLVGFLAAEAPLLLRLVLFGLGWERTIPYDVVLAFQVVLPLAVTYAILRYDLFDIDAVVRRALAYTAATAALLGLYLGGAMFFSNLLASMTPGYQGAAVFLGLVLAALLFRLLYGPIQYLVDRIFYPERLRFAQVIRDLRGRLQQVVSREEVHAILNQELPQRLDAAWGRLLPPAPASDETPPSVGWAGRLVVGDQLLGHYQLGTRRSGLRYDVNEQLQLQALVDQAALALAYADLLDELNHLNRDLERKVAEQTAQMLEQQRTLAIAEERRRLARDLHDSVTQTLFSMGLGLRALRKLLAKDPQAVEAGLAEQEAAAQQALAEMRALLAQLRTPLLAEGDLAQALRAHCIHLHQQTGLLVELDAPERIDLPLETAAELLYIAKEALHNVVKYAGVSTAACRLFQTGDGVHLEVEDAGRGFDPASAPTGPGQGLGLQNMRERAAKIGAAFTVEARPGVGVKIHVHAPKGGKP